MAKTHIISIHDVDQQADIIKRQLAHVPAAIPNALQRMARRIAKHVGLTSKYKPHQGEKEMKRRVVASVQAALIAAH